MTYYMSIYPQAIHCSGMYELMHSLNRIHSMILLCILSFSFLVAQNGILQFIFVPAVQFQVSASLVF